MYLLLKKRTIKAYLTHKNQIYQVQKFNKMFSLAVNTFKTNI